MPASKLPKLILKLDTASDLSAQKAIDGILALGHSGDSKSYFLLIDALTDVRVARVIQLPAQETALANPEVSTRIGISSGFSTVISFKFGPLLERRPDALLTKNCS